MAFGKFLEVPIRQSVTPFQDCFIPCVAYYEAETPLLSYKKKIYIYIYISFNIMFDMKWIGATKLAHKLKYHQWVSVKLLVSVREC